MNIQTDDISKDKTCLTPECGKPARWKGLCQACYGCAKTMIDREEVTWEELEAVGLAILPKNLLRREYFRRKDTKCSSKIGEIVNDSR